MTKEGDITSRELLRQTNDMLAQHMRDSNDWRNEMSSKMATIETNGFHLSKTVTDNVKDVDMLKSAHNRQKGAIWAIGSVGTVGFLHTLKQIFGL